MKVWQYMRYTGCSTTQFQVIDFPLQILNFRAQCSSSLAFPSSPHSHASFATRTRHDPNPGCHLCKFSLRTEACATVCNTLISSGALCSSLFPLPTSLHSRAPLALRYQRARVRHAPAYDISRPAEACATANDTSHPQNPASSQTVSQRSGAGITA